MMVSNQGGVAGSYRKAEKSRAIILFPVLLNSVASVCGMTSSKIICRR